MLNSLVKQIWEDVENTEEGEDAKHRDGARGNRFETEMICKGNANGKRGF